MAGGRTASPLLNCSYGRKSGCYNLAGDSGADYPSGLSNQAKLIALARRNDLSAPKGSAIESHWPIRSDLCRSESSRSCRCRGLGCPTI